MFVRVAPGQDDDGVALADQPAQHRVGGRQVEEVVHVDPGRHDDQRPRGHLASLRRVLDQLDQRIAVDHAAGLGCRGRLQRRLQRRQAQCQSAVVNRVGQATRQVAAGLLQRAAQYLGFGQPGIGRCQDVQPWRANVRLPGLGAAVGAHHRRLRPLVPGRVGEAQVLDGGQAFALLGQAVLPPLGGAALGIQCQLQRLRRLGAVGMGLARLGAVGGTALTIDSAH